MNLTKNKGILFIILLTVVLALAAGATSVSALTCEDVSSQPFCNELSACTWTSGTCGPDTDIACGAVTNSDSCFGAHAMTFNETMRCRWEPTGNGSCVEDVGGGASAGGFVSNFSDPCWSYGADSTTCEAQTNTYGCFWDSYSFGGSSCFSMCEKPYGSSATGITSLTGCSAANTTQKQFGGGCSWSGSACTFDFSDFDFGPGGESNFNGCFQYDFTSQTQCENNSLNMSCSWSAGMNLCDPKFGAGFTGQAGGQTCNGTFGSDVCFLCSDQPTCEASADPIGCEWNDEFAFCKPKFDFGFGGGAGGAGGFTCSTDCFACFGENACGQSATNCTWTNDTYSPTGGFCDPAAFANFNSCTTNPLACEGQTACVNSNTAETPRYWNTTYFVCLTNATSPELCFIPGDEDGDGLADCADYQGTELNALTGGNLVNNTSCATSPACGFGGGFSSNFGFGPGGAGGGGSGGAPQMGFGAIDPGICFQHDNNLTNCQNQKGTNSSPLENTSVCFYHSAPGQDAAFDLTNVSAPGWCDPLMNQMMGSSKMDKGAPVILGNDDDTDENDSRILGSKWLNITGIGIVETAKTISLGIGVTNLTDFIGCQKVYSATTLNGSGKYYRYFDVDNNATTGCNATTVNITAEFNTTDGFDFKVIYELMNNSNLSQANITIEKCVDHTTWIPNTKAGKPTPIYDMCELPATFGATGALGGVNVLMVQKKDIGNPFGDLRIIVSTANHSGNESFPTDSAGPFYYTPGTVGFEPNDCMVNPSACGVNFQASSGGEGGYMIKEDCGPTAATNTVDLDKDGLAGCNDFDCQFAPWCAGLSTYNPSADTTFPSVTWSTVNKLADSAFIMWDVNEPTNGSLALYGTDSNCLVVNRTFISFNDPSVTFDDFKPFHDVFISGLSDGAVLSTNTSYYYKTTSCDQATPNAHCAVSKCLNFTTTNTFPSISIYTPFVPLAGSSTSDFLGGMGFYISTASANNFSDWNTSNQQQSGVNTSNLKNVDIKLKNPNLGASPTKNWEITFLNATVTQTKKLNFTGHLNMTNTGTNNETLLFMNSSKFEELKQAFGVSKVQVKIPNSDGTARSKMVKCSGSDGTDCQDVTANLTYNATTGTGCVFNANFTICNLSSSFAFTALQTQSGGLTFNSDQTEYFAYNITKTAYINVTNTNTTLVANAGARNLTVNVSSDVTGASFTIELLNLSNTTQWINGTANNALFTDYNFTEATHQFRINVTMNFANSGRWNFTVRINNTFNLTHTGMFLASINLSVPADANRTTDTTPTFNFTYNTSYYENDTCTLYMDASATSTAPADEYNSTTGPNSTATVLTANASLDDGNWTWRIGCVNNETETGYSAVRNILVDTTGPTVNLDAAPADNNITADPTPTFTFNFTDVLSSGNGVCTLYIGSAATPYGNNSSALNGTSTTITANATIANGSTTWNVNCTDALGNEGASSSRTIVIDNGSLPNITSTSPSAGATTVSISRPTLTFTFNDSRMDNNTINTTTVYLNATSAGTTIAGAVGNTDNLTFTFTPSANLAYSTAYTLTITTSVADIFGNALATAYQLNFTTAAEPATTGDSSPPKSSVGTAATVTELVITKASPTQTVSMGVGDSSSFSVGGESHSARVKKISGSQVTVTVSSTPKEVVLEVNKAAYVDVDDNGGNDIKLLMTSVKGGVAVIEFTLLKTATPAPDESAAATTTEEPATTTDEPAAVVTTPTTTDTMMKESGLSSGTLTAVVIVVLLLIGGAYFYMQKKE